LTIRENLHIRLCSVRIIGNTDSISDNNEELKAKMTKTRHFLQISENEQHCVCTTWKTLYQLRFIQKRSVASICKPRQRGGIVDSALGREAEPVWATLSAPSPFGLRIDRDIK